MTVLDRPAERRLERLARDEEVPRRQPRVERVRLVDRLLVEADEAGTPALADSVPAQRLDGAGHRRAGLDLDHEPHLLGEPGQDLVEGRDAQPGAAEPVRGVRAGELGAGIGLADLGQRVLHDRSAAVGGAVERVVVDHDERPVRRDVEVELDRVGALAHAELEALHRVLGGMRGRAAMADDERHGWTSAR